MLDFSKVLPRPAEVIFSHVYFSVAVVIIFHFISTCYLRFYRRPVSARSVKARCARSVNARCPRPVNVRCARPINARCARPVNARLVRPAIAQATLRFAHVALQ